MAATRTANANWRGGLTDGEGVVSLDSSNIGRFPVSWAARTEESGGMTSPEELIAAAHSSCFSMALSKGLADAGSPPQSIDTRADVTFRPGVGITDAHLTVRASVPGMSPGDFTEAAEQAKSGCPVSQALTGTTITLDAQLA